MIENNLDGQLHKILQTEFPSRRPNWSRLLADGLPLSALDYGTDW